MVVSRRKKQTVTSSTGIEIDKIFCRKCMKNLKPTEFFTAVDKDLDSNGFFSICKRCCDELYSGYYRIEHDVARAILQSCRKLNIKFDEASVESTVAQLKTYADKGRQTDSVLGIYKGKLIANSKNNMSDKSSSIDLTFVEPSVVLPPAHPLDDSKTSFDLQQYWGDNYNFDDYQYLEREMSEWRKTHRCDTKAEETLLKEICHKSLEIRRQRLKNGGGSTATLVKELQDLMKTASVDPSKTSSIGAGKSQETFSAFIKIIEENEPADFYKDKELFKDVDNIDWYFKKYLTRPLKNFITQSRDFNVEEDDEESDFDSLEELTKDDKE